MLAKPLDWCVIQLARRCVRLESGLEPESGELNLGLAQCEGPCTGVANPPDWAWAAEGAFQFSSQIQTPFRENNTVHGRLLRTGEKWRKQPTIILLHGWNAELCYRHLFPYLAMQLRRAGINTVMIELPYHMRRRPRHGPVTDFISSDLPRMLEATRQAIADVRVLVHWLLAEGAPAVGLWGFSLGAWLAGLTTCTEPHLHCAVLATPIARIDRVIAELPFCEPVWRSVQRQRVDLKGLNLASRVPQIDPSRILLVEARHDLFAPAATVEELWRAWRHPNIWRLPHGHITALMSVPFMRRTVRWIQAQASC